MKRWHTALPIHELEVNEIVQKTASKDDSFKDGIYVCFYVFTYI